MTRTMVHFDLDCDNLFLADQGSGGFTPVILVQIKLKSRKVRTKWHRCERALRCVRFMWLFSDLHALEVELWIHCFCTRLHPSRVQIVTKLTSVLYEGFQLWLVFLPQHFRCFFIHKSKTNNQCWDLTEHSLESGLDMGSGNFMYQPFRLQRVSRASIERFLSPGLFFTQCVYWTPSNTV